MLMPSTITARRTRRYTSTWYIRRTIHRLNFNLWMAADGPFFNRQLSAGQSARMVHFNSAFYKCDLPVYPLWLGGPARLMYV